jgi:uncharacterized protein involved in exopolysaccharide biosynthesis
VRDDSVELVRVLSAVAKGRVWVLILAVVGAATLGVRAWLATPIYRSEAIVVIADDSKGGFQGLMGGELGAIASLAGVDLGGSRDRRAQYLALLTSKGLIRDFIASENLLPVLFSNRWDPAKQTWRASRWHDNPPPMDDAVRKFLREVLQVTEDRQTGLITVQIEWKDREVAAQWVDLLIGRVNDQVRKSAITEAQSNIDFLYAELMKNSAVEVRDGIYRLIEGNLGRVVLANTQRQYALKILDPPIVPDERRFVRPKLPLETALGAVLGAFLGALLALWLQRRHWWPSRTR